jgi:hypothetical protein
MEHFPVVNVTVWGVTIFNTLTMLKRLVDGQRFPSQQLQPDVAEYCLYHRVDA